MIERKIGEKKITHEKLFEDPDYSFVATRHHELTSLMEYLLRNSLLSEQSLKGPITDLGTGSGVGPLVLRQFSPGYISGVDLPKKARSYYNAGGSSKIDASNIMKLAQADLRHENMYTYLKTRAFNSRSLVTAFNACVMEWRNDQRIWHLYNQEDLYVISDEIGNILEPGGQFLFTSDKWDIPTPNWASQVTEIKGTSLPRLTLSLPSSINRSENIELLRDRFIKILTK